MTLTSTGVSRDNDTSTSGSSKTLKQKETNDCHDREKQMSPPKNSFKYSKHLRFVLTNQPAARREILESLSMTFTADGKQQRLPLIFHSFVVILK